MDEVADDNNVGGLGWPGTTNTDQFRVKSFSRSKRHD